MSKIASKFKKAQDLSLVKELDPLNDRELTRAIRDAIAAEIGAIKQYETLVDSTSNEKVKKVLQSISNEEKVHIGELEALLKELLKDEQGFMDDGLKEVEDE
jgi:rubrerythrin